MEFSGNAEYVRFRQSPPLINADRTLLYPTVSWTQRGNAWFFTARAGLHVTHYDLEDSTATDTHINRVLPIGSLDCRARVRARRRISRAQLPPDAGAPRLLRLHTLPQQSQIPAFDTAIDDFNFSQLFTENRYLGSDRIGDANQLTLAATTPLLDPTSGEERLRFALGQRYYFEDQR